MGNWHPYNRIDPDQPQTRIVFLAGNQGGVCTEGDDDAVLVCGDQVVTFEGRVREKPADLDEARRFAQSYSGSSCSTVGCVITHDILHGTCSCGVLYYLRVVRVGIACHVHVASMA